MKSILFGSLFATVLSLFICAIDFILNDKSISLQIIYFIFLATPGIIIPIIIIDGLYYAIMSGMIHFFPSTRYKVKFTLISILLGIITSIIFLFIIDCKQTFPYFMDFSMTNTRYTLIQPVFWIIIFYIFSFFLYKFRIEHSGNKKEINND